METVLMTALKQKKPVPGLADLIATCPNINATDEYGRTALFYARGEGQVKALLEAGADATIRDKDGETVLFPLARRGEERGIFYALQGGADSSIRNNEGFRAVDCLPKFAPNSPKGERMTDMLRPR